MRLGTVTIAADVLAALEAEARHARPAECCGLLIGPRGGDAIVASRPAANLSPTPNRFELDPQAHVRALRETRATGLDVIGFYHSHPASAPFPSATDLAESSYPTAVHVIVGFPGGRDVAEARAFSVRDDGFDERQLAVVGG